MAAARRRHGILRRGAHRSAHTRDALIRACSGLPTCRKIKCFLYYPSDDFVEQHDVFVVATVDARKAAGIFVHVRPCLCPYDSIVR